MRNATTGAMTSSSRGASCTKPSNGVFRTQSFIQNGTIAKIAALSIFAKSSILDVWPGPKYASALYPQNSAKIQLLSALSKFSINLLVYFFQNSYKIVLKQFKIA